VSVDKNVISKPLSSPTYTPEHMPGELSAQFLTNNPPFGVLPRNDHQMNSRLPNNDLIPEKLYEAEQTKQQINRYCRQLQSLLFLLPEFPDADVPDEVVDYYLKATGDLIYMLFHLSDVSGGDSPSVERESRRGNENEQ